VGNILGPIQPGGPSNGMQDIVIASYGSDGVLLWTKVIGTSGVDYASSVALGTNTFYVGIDLASNIGASIEGTPILGTPAPVGVLLKLQP
jgi:hypothetical protein